MRTKTTITLLVLAGILAGLVWLMRGNKPDASTVPSRLIPIDVNRITAWTLSRSTFEVECTRSGQDWLITKPFKARANAGAIERILHTLAEMQCVETITAEQRRRRGLTLDDYGVGDKPRSRMTLVSVHTNITILLGRDALDDVLYTRLANDETVLTTTAAIAPVLPESIDDLRDRNIFRCNIATVSRLEIARPSSGFIQASRKDGQWTMQQPAKGARLDREKLKKLLKALQDAQAERFIVANDNAKTGLEESQVTLRIAVWNGDEPAGQQLLLGKEVPEHKNEVYARFSDSECVCTVKKEFLDTFNIRASDIRDTVMFPVSPVDIMKVDLREGERKLEFRRSGKDWLIAEPRRMKTDALVMNELLAKLCSLQVDEFVETQEPLSAMGLDPAARSIEVATSLPPETEPAGPAPAKHDPGLRRVLLVGKEVGGDRGFYARFEDEPSILRIGNEPLKSILAARYSSLPAPVRPLTNETSAALWINPLLYCNRTMLELERDSIVAISLRKEGREQSVFKDEAGTWQPVPPLAGKVQTDIIKDILEAAVALQAMEIRCEGGENPASYGLDNSAARLTFGLGDNKGIRKTLLVGFRAGSDGVYAMIQGQDVVFVLPIRLVGKLLRDLIPEEEHGG